jgi:hypothetical protein
MADALLPPVVGSVNPTLDALAPPSFAQPPMAAPMAMAPQPQAPSFLRTMLPVLASAIAAKGNPAAMGTGLAAYTQGQRLKRAQQEDEWTSAQRERMEAAQFYSRAIEQAQQFDDPVAFESWRQAIAPVAQVYGVPVESIAFNGQKASQKQAVSTIDTLRKVHGDVVDDPEWQAQNQVAFDGRTVPVSVVYGAAKLPVVTSLSGTLVGPSKTNALTPNTPEEQFYATFAKERGAKSFAALTTAQQGEAREEWSKRGRQPTAPATAGSFEAYVTTYAAEKGTTPDKLTTAQLEDARKRFQQSDDRPITVNTGANATRTAARIDRVATAFSNHPIVKNYNEIQLQAGTIEEVVNGQWSGPGDMSIVFGFMRALDPTSVVRESEYTNAAKAGNIFAGWAARFNGLLNPSGGFLSDQVKRDFLRTIQSRLAVSKKGYDNLRRQMVSKVDRINRGEPETGDEAIIEYTLPNETPANGGAPPTAQPMTDYSRYLESRKGKK